MTQLRGGGILFPESQICSARYASEAGGSSAVARRPAGALKRDTPLGCEDRLDRRMFPIEGPMFPF